MTDTTLEEVGACLDKTTAIVKAADPTSANPADLGDVKAHVADAAAKLHNMSRDGVDDAQLGRLEQQMRVLVDAVDALMATVYRM